MRAVWFVAVVLLFQAWIVPPSSAQQRPVLVRDSVTPLVIGDALVKPPSGADWYIVDRSNRGVFFQKKTQAPLHSFYAAALMKEFPLGAGVPEDIFERMKADVERRSGDGGRFKVLEFEFGPEEAKFGARCARYVFKSEDHAARGAEGKMLLLTAAGYLCVSPQMPNMYLDLHYSERGGPQAISAELQKEGEAFLQGAAFSTGN